MVMDRYTTAQVATLQSADHEVPLQTLHIDGSPVTISFKASVIFQANNNNNNNNNKAEKIPKYKDLTIEIRLM